MSSPQCFHYTIVVANRIGGKSSIIHNGLWEMWSFLSAFPQHEHVWIATVFLANASIEYAATWILSVRLKIVFSCRLGNTHEVTWRERMNAPVSHNLSPSLEPRKLLRSLRYSRRLTITHFLKHRMSNCMPGQRPITSEMSRWHWAPDTYSM